MFEAARVGVPLIKKIVETARQIEFLRYFASEKGQVHDEEAAQFCLRNGSSFAHVLGIDAGKESLLHQRNAEIHLGQLFRRIGQDPSGHYVPGVL